MGEEARHARRREFIDAGWQCIARKGYRNITIDDIAAELGLSKGAFYSHFDHKEDLLFALLDDEASGLEDLINDVGEHQHSGVERIRRFLRVVVEWGEDPARAQLRADLWAEVSMDESLRAKFAERVRTRRSLLARWVSDAVESGEMIDLPANAFASILLALSDGLMLHSSLDPGGFRWANIRKAVGSLLDALRVEEVGEA